MPCYLYYGDEPYLINKKLKEITGSINLPEFNVSKFEDFTAETLDACRQYPSMADYRVVIVEGDVFSKNNELLLEYVKEDDPSTMLILVPPAVDKRKKLFKEIKKSKGLKEFRKLNRKQLHEFIKDRVKTNDGTISFENTDYFIDRLGYLDRDSNICLYDVISSLNKLLFYNKNITRESIDTLIKPSASDNVFKLVDYIVRKDSKKAFSHLEGLLELNNNSIGLISLILRHFRLVYKVSLYKDNSNLSKELGVHSRALSSISKQNISPGTIHNIIDACNEKVMGIKKGVYPQELAPKILLAEILSLI